MSDHAEPATLHHTSDPAKPPRDSACAVLLRDGVDGAAGLQVFLMQRSSQSESFGNAYVFPGGKLDAHDCTPAATHTLDTPMAQLAQRLGEPALPQSMAAGLFVAALRELFEEAGVLLSPSPTRPASNRPHDWQAWLAQPDTRLGASALVPWSRWITPRRPALSGQRFDTRFFLALAPADQHARHDAYETTASAWLSPVEALQRYQRGEITLAPPQIMSLGHLARYPSAAAALDAAQRQPPPCIRPENFEEHGTITLCYPGDPHHPESTRALPGPTRLVLSGQRFVPDGAFELLWQ